MVEPDSDLEVALFDLKSPNTEDVGRCDWIRRAMSRAYYVLLLLLLVSQAVLAGANLGLCHSQDGPCPTVWPGERPALAIDVVIFLGAARVLLSFGGSGRGKELGTFFS